MTAGRGDLESALDDGLAGDVGEVGVALVGVVEQRAGVGLRRRVTRSVGERADRVTQRRHRRHADVGHERRLGGVGLRYDHTTHTAAAQALDDGQHAADRAHRPVERELAERRYLLPAVAARLARRQQERECDGQVEARPLFAQVGRRQVDRDAPRRELEAAVDDRGADALATLLHGRVGQAHDREGGGRRHDVGLDLDGVPLQSVESFARDVRDHLGALIRRR